jgi:PhzF family phenazine biosynthesis protein
MQLPIYHINAFSRELHGGNPAGVVVLPGAAWLGADAPQPGTEILQHIATKQQLPVISYLRPIEGGFDLSWFTPASKLSLCGHGTLAAAHHLWESGLLALEEPARFHTAAGWVEVKRLSDGFMEINFPAHQYSPGTLPAPLVSAFGLGRPEATGPATKSPSDLLPLAVLISEGRYILELSSEAEVRNYQPDPRLLGQHRVVITAPANPGSDYDFVSRYFHGTDVPEDWVTGSTHCMLTPYWANKLGKEELKAFQASSRGGLLRLRLAGDRVLIAGQALSTGEGVVEY